MSLDWTIPALQPNGDDTGPPGKMSMVIEKQYKDYAIEFHYYEPVGHQ